MASEPSWQESPSGVLGDKARDQPKVPTRRYSIILNKAVAKPLNTTKSGQDQWI